MPVTKSRNIQVQKNTGGSLLSQRIINMIEGTNITLTITENDSNNSIDIQIDASGGGGGGAWSDLTAPTGNLSLAMGNHTTLLTFGSATSTSSLFKLTDTASNTGIGYLLDLTTASGSTLNPFLVAPTGNPALYVDNTGLVTVGSSGLLVGNGGTLKSIYRSVSTIDYSSIAAGSFLDITISITNASVGDPVIIGAPAGSVDNGISFFGWVSAPNTVIIRAINNDSTSHDPASGDFTIAVIKLS